MTEPDDDPADTDLDSAGKLTALIGEVEAALNELYAIRGHTWTLRPIRDRLEKAIELAKAP